MRRLSLFPVLVLTTGCELLPLPELQEVGEPVVRLAFDSSLTTTDGVSLDTLVPVTSERGQRADVTAVLSVGRGGHSLLVQTGEGVSICANAPDDVRGVRTGPCPEEGRGTPSRSLMVWTNLSYVDLEPVDAFRIRRGEEEWQATVVDLDVWTTEDWIGEGYVDLELKRVPSEW